MLTVIVVVIVALLVIAWIVFTFVVKGLGRKGSQEARELLGGEDRIQVFDEKAICRGTESEPGHRWVGMGSLGLNSDELVFVRWSPHEVVRIPRSEIVSHVFTTEFRERQFRKPILQLSVSSPDHTDGEVPGQDQIAFEVADQDAWDRALA